VFEARADAGYRAGEQVVFAELVVLGTTVTLEEANEFDPVPQPGPILEAGWSSRSPTSRTGARGGRLRDPFGVQWLVQTPLTFTAEGAAQAPRLGSSSPRRLR
jgi:PhnB protein